MNKPFYHKLYSYPILVLENGTWCGRKMSSFVTKISVGNFSYLVVNKSMVKEGVDFDGFLTLYLSANKTSERVHPNNKAKFVEETTFLYNRLGGKM